MIQAAYLLSEHRGQLVGHTEEWNHLWNTACGTGEKYMRRDVPNFKDYNFNLIFNV